MAAPTLVNVLPKVYKEFTVEIEGSDYAPAVASCKFTPNQNTQTWKGGKPSAVFTDMGAPTWQCAMKVGQDLAPTSFVRYLIANAGASKECKFTPVQGGPVITATLILAAPELGGDIDAFGETTITHGVQGAPAIA